MSNGLSTLNIALEIPSPDNVVSYRYTLKDGSTGALISGMDGIQVPRTGLTAVAGSSPAKRQFTTAAVPAYKTYIAQVAAVGYGSVLSTWTSPAAVAGLFDQPSSVTMSSGSTSLAVSFKSAKLLTATDTFRYKLFKMASKTGDQPTAVGAADGETVLR